MPSTAPADTPPWVLSSSAASSGVSTIPNRLEKVALHTAAAVLPRAMVVKAIEDCTVDGSRQRNSTPWYSCGVSTSGTSSRAATPSSGNSTKVEANTVPCSRHCFSPSTASRVDNRAPYRKNSSATAAVEAWDTPVAAMPRAGSRQASPTVPSSEAM